MESQRDNSNNEPDQKEKISSSTDTCAPANEQLPSDAKATQDIVNLDVSEHRIVSEGPSCEEIYVIEDEVKEDNEEKDLVVVQGNEDEEDEDEEEKESSFQSLLNVDEFDQLKSRKGNFTEREHDSTTYEECLPSTSANPRFENVSSSDVSHRLSDLSSDIATSSRDTARTSVSQSSQPIPIPSTSRDSPDLEPESNSPKRPTDFGNNVKQSVHVFYPRNPTTGNPNPKSILKKVPMPFRRGQRMYLRDSPESSDYGGSPDSLEDPLLMEALDSPENEENEDLDTSANSGSTLRPRTNLDRNEEKPSISGPDPESFDPQPEPIEGSLEDPQPEPIEGSLEDRQPEPIEGSLEDRQPEPIEGSLEDPQPEPIEGSLEDPQPEPIKMNLDDP